MKTLSLYRLIEIWWITFKIFILDMSKIELETERDDSTINDFAEEINMVLKTKMVKKEEILHKFVAKDVIKNKMIAVAGQMFVEYEKELDNSNQTIKGYVDCIGDNKIGNDKVDKSLWR